MPNEYLRRMERLHKISLAKISRKQDKEIIQIYRRALNETIKGNNWAKKALTKRYYNERSKAIYDELLKLTEGNIKQAALLHTDYSALMIKMGFKAGNKTQFRRMFANIPDEVVRVFTQGGLYKDGLSLSSRIWKTSTYSTKEIQEIITSGLTAGMSTKELAELLQEHVNPASAKKWSDEKIEEKLGKLYKKNLTGIDYNAIRLARTTISHAYTLSAKMSAPKVPFLEKFQWLSSLSHGRTCDICQERHLQIYSVDDLPYDHPNGLCTQIPYLPKTLEQYGQEIGGWVDGKPNKALDKWYKNNKKDLDKII